MQVLIRGWSARNLRGGLKQLDIDLGEQPNRWTLIQMANGMGKTTTMTLLRQIFTNEPLPPAQVLEMRGGNETEGSFEARLLIDGKPYRLGFEFDFRDGSVHRYTVRAEERDGGKDPGRILPPELADLLTPDFARLFVFDGELARTIRDMKQQTADNAIRALYRLGQISGLKGSIDKLVDLEQRRAAAMTSATEERGMTRLRNARDEATREKRRLEKEVRTTRTLLDERRADRDRLDAAVEERLSEDEGVRERLDDLNRRELLLKVETNALGGEALALIRQPPQVHPRIRERLQFLGGRLFELKLPETISTEFFQDLAAKDLCVCGRPLGHEDKEHILKHSHRYLAQDQISVINQMKLALRENPGDAGEFDAKIIQLGEKLVERQTLKSARDKIELERISEGDDDMERLRLQLAEVKTEIERLESQYERLTTRDTHRQRTLRLNWQSNLPMCEAEEKERDDRLTVASNTRAFKLKAETLKDLIVDFERRALARLRERIRLRTNEKLHQIAKTERLEVTRIAGGLEISGPDSPAKAGVSEGQSLSVAYAFLTSLLSEAPYRLPFVVDSPAVSLDNVNRRQVGQIIPGFFDQMIMFVISSEREGFAESFYDKGSDARFLTVIREQGTVRLDDRLEFFKTFQDRDNA
jgi:DNA sulfur modification protein DndD